MSKASLLELCHGEKKYKEILFPVPDGGSDEGAEMAATYHSIIRTVKMQGRSAWEYLGKFFTKSLIKRIESSLLELLSVKTLSNIFNGCRDFFSLRPDKFSCQREQNQTCLSYAECSRKSWNKSDWQYANIFDKWEQWKLAFKLSSEENVCQ